MSDMIEVKVDDLDGDLLDCLVATIKNPAEKVFFNSDGYTNRWHNKPPKFSTDWAAGGPLVHRYGVLLSPPKSMVHRNYGNFDERNGWYESGVWGATIFGNERKHRRRSFNHPDQPLVAAMRAIVQFELGDVVSVPAALVEGGAQ